MLEIDSVRKVFTLSFDGQLSIVKLGTVGATAGRFILDTSNTLSNAPQFWGVATLGTNFKVLEQYGIFLDASGTLQINTTDYPKTETLTLKGIGPNGGNLTQTFNLPKQNFTLQLVGQLRVRPPGTTTDLLNLNGGFHLKIDPTVFEIYATASLSFGAGSSKLVYGQASGLLIIVTGVGAGQSPGVAGRFAIGSSADIGLPNIGNLFSASGKVTVVFNTTFQDRPSSSRRRSCRS